MYYSSFDDLRAQYLFELKQDPIEQILYHYTSPGGFDGIILNDNKTPTFWFSRYDCLNDITEGNNITEIYRSVIDELLSYEDWDAVFLNHIRNVKPADQAFFLAELSEEEKQKTGVESIVEVSETDTYLLCFSKEPDDLSMWRYYVKDDEYNGFNIGIDSVLLSSFFSSKPSLQGFKFRLIDVIYDDVIKRNYIKQFIESVYAAFLIEETNSASDSIEKAQTIISEFLSTVRFYFKNDHFKNEKEVRAVITIPKDVIWGAKEQFIPEIKYRRTKAYTIPYFEMPIEDNTIVASVTIGPLDVSKTVKQKQCAIVKEQLEAFYPEAEVRVSDVPIRY